MKTIGLIGGMSWESTVPYYAILNQEIKNFYGGYASAKIILYSVDFSEIEAAQTRGDWETTGNTLGNIALTLQNAGADAIVLCTNTMHKVSDKIQSMITIPFIHIADAVAEEVKRFGFTNVALLGTMYTMTQDFYVDRLKSHGLNVLLPKHSDMEIIHSVIFDELVIGIIREESRKEYRRIISDLVANGAQGIILGCTEIGLLVKAEDASVPLFDTVKIHALQAARFMTESES